MFLALTNPRLSKKPMRKDPIKIIERRGADFKLGTDTGFKTVNNGVSFLTCKR